MGVCNIVIIVFTIITLSTLSNAFGTDVASLISGFTRKRTTEEQYEMKMEMKKNCENNTISHSSFEPGDYNNHTYCNETFDDNQTCWDTTPGGATASRHCPGYISGFDPNLYVYKKCNEDGTWLTMPGEDQSWPNSTCVNWAELKFRRIVNYVYVSGYIISSLSIVISLAIFVSFKGLHCLRVRIHKHLFVSCALSNICWIIWFQSVVNTNDTTQGNTIWCQLLHVVANYFVVTSYFWMCLEAIYLHLVLTVVFVKNELAMRWFVAIGWGFSLAVITVYASTRFFFGDTTSCWIDHDNLVWIFLVPVGITQCISAVFFVCIVKVLVTKIRPTPNQGNMAVVKKAGRATCILIPLFGLHFTIFPFRPTKDAFGDHTYQVIAALTTSLQGFALSLIFCFTNQEVMTAIKKRFLNWKNKKNNEAIIMTGLTGGGTALRTRGNVI